MSEIKTILQSSHSRRPLMQSRMIAAVLLMIWLPAMALACAYSKYGFTPGDTSQTNVNELFGGHYTEGQKGWLTDDWQREVLSLEEAGAPNSTDLLSRLNYAWALHMANENPKSAAIYESILKTDPNNYETLCSYATLLQVLRHYPKAREMLAKAVAIKPGFRSNAEEFHLAMIDFQEKNLRDSKYGSNHTMLEPFYPIWKNRKGVDQNLSTVTFPEGYTSNGMVELTRQFPLNGECWFMLGMLLEHEKDFSMAAKSYDRALEKGTAHAEEIRRYMTTFREFGRSNDPGRLAGRGFVKLLGALLGLFILYKLFMVAARVINDVSGTRAAKEEQARRNRRKHIDPDSPL